MKSMIFHGMKFLALGLAVLALGACSSTPMKGYSGPALPAGETAVVRSGAYTDIVSVDGMRVSGSSVAVTPGTHIVEMKPDQPIDNATYVGPGNYYFYSLVNGTTTFTAEPGHTYEVYANLDTERRSEEGYGAENPGTSLEQNTGFTWTGYVVDDTTYNRVARTDTLPLQAYWRGDAYGGHGGIFH